MGRKGQGKAKKDGKPGRRVVARNRRAFHEFEILEKLEAGLVLQGTEVKSLRAGRCNLGDSYAVIKDGEAWLLKMHISPYEQGNRQNHDPFRRRKLLLTRRELRKLAPRLEQQGLTLVPLQVYFTPRGLAKVELGLARGKKRYDKRQAMAKRDAERAMRQRMGRQ